MSSTPKRAFIGKKTKKSRNEEDNDYRPHGEKMDTIHLKMETPRPTRSRGDKELSKGLSNEKKQKKSKTMKEVESLFERKVIMEPENPENVVKKENKGGDQVIKKESDGILQEVKQENAGILQDVKSEIYPIEKKQVDKL
ncbi:hypothetical protein GCK72_025437 [Caenorhabditis remanei]|uniref:Uncharacterized protein n=1 Tax=Caenorhabditis remanei TaxID=31234 RepID=A0A6A5G1Y5_CAERE|nr:hypothetical protein GCK72_025437 [Caenorhabditis remanei]KAF1748970.1 hypothetical protein GCK72_025437 [Caenorhabditis remanei]